ncbi:MULTISPECIES: hypothetical protein [unclassified Nonomuraea]|uniref:hypothetical protein n=1 Tax=unclassified Nonomuraea TaxID=2593643 RepID=UPI0014862A93
MAALEAEGGPRHFDRAVLDGKDSGEPGLGVMPAVEIQVGFAFAVLGEEPPHMADVDGVNHLTAVGGPQRKVEQSAGKRLPPAKTLEWAAVSRLNSSHGPASAPLLEHVRLWSSFFVHACA